MLSADPDSSDRQSPLLPLQRAAWARFCPLPLWGMVHLPPLPGSPRFAGDPDAAERFALQASGRLVEAGYGALMLENFGDAPFRGRRVDAVTVAAMARCAASIRARFPALRIGINCLRNDAIAALSIAAACGADAIRVNVHCGSAWSDQGLLSGRADRSLRLRRELGANVRIFADLRVKHAVPAGERDLLDEAMELRERGLADAILVTGPATGREASLEQCSVLHERLEDTPILVASGIDAENVAAWAAVADGAIVGSALMEGAKAGGAIDVERARLIRTRWQDAGNKETGSFACA